MSATYISDSIGINDSVRTLHRAAQDTIDRLERRHAGRTRVEMVRREIERESDEEIRAALRGQEVQS